jgi:hypothetical protein
VEEQLPIQDYGSLATEGQTTQHARMIFVFSHDSCFAFVPLMLMIQPSCYQNGNGAG